MIPWTTEIPRVHADVCPLCRGSGKDYQGKDCSLCMIEEIQVSPQGMRIPGRRRNTGYVKRLSNHGFHG